MKTEGEVCERLISKVSLDLITPPVLSKIGTGPLLIAISRLPDSLVKSTMFNYAYIKSRALLDFHKRNLITEDYLCHLSKANGGPPDDLDAILQWATAKSEPLALFMMTFRYGDPSTSDNYCIKMAAKTGKYSLVRALLEHPEVDPTADHNYPLRYASYYSHTKIVDVLLSDSRVNPPLLNLWEDK